MHSSMRSKKARGIVKKILVPWDVDVHEVSQEVAVASFFLSLKGLTQWLGFLPGDGWACGCRAGGSAGLRCVYSQLKTHLFRLAYPPP